jgi:hypothetical protein
MIHVYQKVIFLSYGDHNKSMETIAMAKPESVLKATYEILKHCKYSGVTTFIFRKQLRERLQEYNDEIIRELEEILIHYEWILKDKKNKLLIPTNKLLSAAEYKLMHLEERVVIPMSNEIRPSKLRL